MKLISRELCPERVRIVSDRNQPKDVSLPDNIFDDNH